MTPCYIGPGGGFAVTASVVTVVVLAVTVVLGPVIFPISAMWHLLRRVRSRCRSPFRRVVVLGLDGLDAGVAREMMDAGQLPNLRRLARSGHFSELATVAPALTPAAWSSFATGCDPSYHNIYDFISRDPATYTPMLSSFRIMAAGGDGTSLVSRALARLRGVRPEPMRRGIPFWHALARRGLEVTVLRVPITFPPERFRGRLLSGMCVPDVIGTQGTYTYYATRDCRLEPGGDEFIAVRFAQGVATTVMRGPARKVRGTGHSTLPLILVREGSRHSVALHLPDVRLTLEAGEWSAWLELCFRDRTARVRGLVRFYLRSCEPDFQLYMTPVHLHPERPAMAISHPTLFSSYLAKRGGLFGTLGLIEDTAALNAGVVDEAGFLRQAWETYGERRSMFLRTLDLSADDVVICVFDTPDRIQHMFWRFRDRDHPSLNVLTDTRNSGAIAEMMREMDRLVGQTMERIDSGTLLLVISDHGFTTFRRAINLNTWLLENGYLNLLSGASLNRDWLAGVDWSRTAAYAIGLAGIFINLKGREACGFVEPEAYSALANELKGKLEAMVDPAGSGGTTARRPVRCAYVTASFFDGPHRAAGPDLIVGYEHGYRVSWECARGQVGRSVFSDNTRAWSGDHCIDPKLVPGVLFSNHPLRARAARIIDIAPTVLDVFGVPQEPTLQGTSLLRAGEP
jgi:predicted AlkP superfamily phosphohydrolase/phosphomutase